MCVIDDARQIKSSNGRKIARMASDQENRSDPSCFMKKFRTVETNEKFPKNSKNDQKKLRKIQKIDIADVINY